jgi:hypothetical protein
MAVSVRRAGFTLVGGVGRCCSRRVCGRWFRGRHDHVILASQGVLGYLSTAVL